MTRVCLDSNVLVAAFAARGLCADLLKRVLSDYDLVIPEIVAEEVQRILTSRLKPSRDALSSVQAFLERCSVVPKGNEPCPIPLRDPDDERVLADAISAGAEILVSGDQDILVAADHSPIRILSPRAFLTLTRGPS